SSANGRQTPSRGSANRITGLAGSQAGRNGFNSSDRVANRGGSAMACRGGGSGTEGSRAKPQQQPVAGSKREFNGSAGRPPLTAIGPNPKRGGEHRQQQQQQQRQSSRGRTTPGR
ncbi:unnamed protein product, partial [Ectocarpus sp. 12 AP-2014]